MKKLDIYVFREMFVPFLIGSLAVVLMFQANTYIWLAKTFNLENVPIAARFQYILFMTPSYLRMTLPVASALAASLAMTRLARDSEITAIRAGGTRILRVVAPMAVFGFFVALLNFWVVDNVIPKATARANKVVAESAALGLGPATFRSNMLIDLKDYTASLGQVQRRADGSLSLSDVMLIERPEPEVTWLVTAKSGTYANGVWTFPNALAFRLEGPRVTSVQSKKIVVNDRIVVSELLAPQSEAEVSTAELIQMIDAGKKLRSDVKPLEIELYQRSAVPASCIVFALVAPVFAVWFARSGGFIGVLVSFISVLLYYNAFIISTQILGKSALVPAWLAAWLPNILFAALGLVAYRRIE